MRKVTIIVLIMLLLLGVSAGVSAIEEEFYRLEGMSIDLKKHY